MFVTLRRELHICGPATHLYCSTNIACMIRYVLLNVLFAYSAAGITQIINTTNPCNSHKQLAAGDLQRSSTIRETVFQISYNKHYLHVILRRELHTLVDVVNGQQSAAKCNVALTAPQA